MSEMRRNQTNSSNVKIPSQSGRHNCCCCAEALSLVPWREALPCFLVAPHSSGDEAEKLEAAGALTAAALVGRISSLRTPGETMVRG